MPEVGDLRTGDDPVIGDGVSDELAETWRPGDAVHVRVPAKRFETAAQRLVDRRAFGSIPLNPYPSPAAIRFSGRGGAETSSIDAPSVGQESRRPST